MSGEIALDLSPIIIIYKDGSVKRLRGTDTVPAGLDPKTGVQSTDIVIYPETGQYVRLYDPTPTAETRDKKPLLVYFHGGTFLTSSASDPYFHNYLNDLSSSAGIVIVSVDYRIGPDPPLPAAFDDCWAALKWVASCDSEKYLSSLADRHHLYMAGDGAGASISHQMALRYGLEGGLGGGVELEGIVSAIPYFWGETPLSDAEKDPATRAWIDGLFRVALPSAKNMDDPIINPEYEPNLAKLGVKRILICSAEKDWFRYRALFYYDLLKKSGWPGDVKLWEAKGAVHNFYLDHPESENAREMMNVVSKFLNGQDV